MAFTREQFRTRALRMADALSSGRWDTTAGAAGEVDQHLGAVHAREWRRILNANPHVRMARRTPATDASGQIALADLDGGSGDAAERLYRVLLVAFENTPYKEALAGEAALAAAAAAGPPRTWFRQGDYLIVPDQPSATATGVWVNHLPTRADNLSSDAATVVFPVDYENVLVYEAAARLLQKGGSETQAGNELKGYAEEERQDMLADLARLSAGPTVVQFPDSSAEWGGL